MCGLHPVYIYIWAVFVVAGVAEAVPISLYSKYLFSIIVNICGMHKITHKTWVPLGQCSCLYTIKLSPTSQSIVTK